MSQYDLSKFEPKSWINALADEGSKEALIWWLYKTDAERAEQASRVKELESMRPEAAETVAVPRELYGEIRRVLHVYMELPSDTWPGPPKSLVSRLNEFDLRGPQNGKP